MYKYFKKLENSDEFKIYLVDNWNNWESCYYSNNKDEFTENFYSNFKEVSTYLEIIDCLIEGYFEKREQNDCDDSVIMSFETWKDENLKHVNDIKNQVKICEEEMDILLYYYIDGCIYLKELYPEYRDFILKVLEMLKNARFALCSKCEIKIKKKKPAYIIPNAWFITPNGFMYNCNGKIASELKGHKVANLNLDFKNIEEFLEKNRIIPYDSRFKEEITKSMKNGYVNALQFQCSFNFVDHLPNVLTREILYTLECYKNVCNYELERDQDPDQWSLYSEIYLPENKYISVRRKPKRNLMIKIDVEDLKRSYQPNILELYIGLLNARDNLYQSFRRLNVSKHKKELLEKIYGLSWDVWDKYLNTLIRFCGFHKVETCEKKITTSSLYGVELFKEYLKQGWDLYIVPPIVYDSYLDDITEMDMQSYFVRKHFDKVLNEYEDKGRVLVRDINC